MLKTRYQILFIAAIVLGAYYPALFAEVNQVDDAGMFRWLGSTEGWPLQEIFIPGSGNGLYYRPLLGLSFLIDRHVWGLQESFMHLENILLHLVNGIAVFYLSRALLAEEEQAQSSLPLLSGLLFALHPVNVESVSWISGRTDVLAGSFILWGTFLLVRFRQRHLLRDLFLSGVLITFGILTKEAALGVVLGGLFIVASRNADDKEHASIKYNRYTFLAAAIVISAAACFFIFRAIAFTSNQSNIGHTLTYISTNPTYSFLLILRSFVFYLKKIFWPFPLNFAIVEVDPVYELFAIPVIVACCWIAYRRTLLSAYFVAGMGLICPSLVITFGRIAWTPFAERYVYMASAFIIPAVVHCIACVCKKLEVKPVRLTLYREDRKLTSPGVSISGRIVSRFAVAVILPTAVVGTVGRNITWRTNLSLYEDTARKSPGFKEVHNQYGVALLKKGRMKEAGEQFSIASALYEFQYDEKYDMNLGTLLATQGKYEEALKAYGRVLEKTKGKSVKAQERIVSLLHDQYLKRPGEKLRSRILLNSEKLFILDPDAHTLYWIGKTALALGDQEKALRYLQRASEKFSPDNEYRRYCNTILSRIQKKAA